MADRIKDLSPETLRTYAAVFAMPKRDLESGELYPAGEACEAAAECLLEIARQIEVSHG
jgi:hypothetical protein